MAARLNFVGSFKFSSGLRSFFHHATMTAPYLSAPAAAGRILPSRTRCQGAAVDSVVEVVQEPMEAPNQLDRAAGDSILPLSPTSPSNAGSCNPPPPRSPLLIHQLLYSL